MSTEPKPKLTLKPSSFAQFSGRKFTVFVEMSKTAPKMCYCKIYFQKTGLPLNFDEFHLQLESELPWPYVKAWVEAQRANGVECRCVKVVQPEQHVLVMVKAEPTDESVNPVDVALSQEDRS